MPSPWSSGDEAEDIQNEEANRFAMRLAEKIVREIIIPERPSDVGKIGVTLTMMAVSCLVLSMKLGDNPGDVDAMLRIVSLVMDMAGDALSMGCPCPACTLEFMRKHVRTNDNGESRGPSDGPAARLCEKWRTAKRRKKQANPRNEKGNREDQGGGNPAS